MFDSLVGTQAATQSSQSNSSSKANQAGDRLEAGLETFLKLLTQQFQHQDPTSPMDTNQFTEQLVQLTVAEQSVNTNKSLEQLIKKQEEFSQISALSLIGKSIKYEGEGFSHIEADKQRFEYDVPAEAKSVKVMIVDKQGNVINNIEGKTDKGTYEVEWDGLDNDGKPAPSGSYEIRTLALDKENNVMDVNVSIFAKVDGVKFEDGKNIALIHDEKVDLNKITEVFQ